MQVAVAGPSVWIKVDGRGTFQNSAGMRDFAAEMTHRGHRDFVIDLTNCELMDSTFMGTLAGIALRLGEGGKVRVVRPNERNRSVLSNLGLDRIMQVEAAPAREPEAPGWQAAGGGQPQEEKKQAIIEAHENLVAANPENAVRFKDVLEFLKDGEPGEEARP